MIRQHTRRGVTRKSIAAVAALTLIVGACGGDDDADDADVTTEADAGSDDAVADSGDDDAGDGSGDADATDEGDGGDAGADDSDSEAPATTIELPEITEIAGELRIGVGTDVQTFDPHLAGTAQEYYLNPIFDSLTRRTQDGSIAPGLAADWTIIDGANLDLSIREGVTFSDGTPLDAAAVVANFERGIATEASPNAAWFANLASVTATDDMTVHLELVQPSTSLLEDLSKLPGMMISPASFDGDVGTAPVGAGGWVYDADASRPGVEQVYRARTDYWDQGAVGVETVIIRVLDGDAQLNGLLAGELDIVEVANQNRPTVRDAGLDLVSRSDANVYYIQVTDTDGSLLEPMGDIRVRQALNLALDREGFNLALQNGEGSNTPSFFLEDSAMYDASLEQWAWDPDRAVELLDEAGYGDGFEVTLATIAGLDVIAEAVQQAWTAIGLDVSIDVGEPGTLADTMRSGTVAMTPTVARGFTPESHYRERLAPGSPYDPLGTDRGELADLAEVAYGATTVEAQQDAWREVYKYAIDQGYLMVFAHDIPAVGVGANVEGAVLLAGDNVPRPQGIVVG